MFGPKTEYTPQIKLLDNYFTSVLEYGDDNEEDIIRFLESAPRELKKKA